MRNLKAILMGSAAIACMGMVSETAQAQSIAFGAGATFPQIAYRELMDCLYNQLQGHPPGTPGKPTARPKAASCPSFNQSTFGGAIVYAGTGSGNGKAVLKSNNPATISTPGTTVPWTDSTLGINSTADYIGVQFAGSDDVLTASDLVGWNYANFGNPIQISTLAGPVGLGFNGKDGTGATLNILPVTPVGGSSGLNLSRNAVCGIASGHITKWNNPILTALNGGVLGTGNITFVHRTDGSGTTFLFVNALVEQCRYEFGPQNETVGTIVSYAFPWTERTATCPVNPLLPKGANTVNWPDQFPTDQCGAPNANPGGGTFANGSGSGGVVSVVTATNGAIGYASSDYWLPVRVGGLKAANIQSQWDITVSTGKFQPPTWQAAKTAMSSSVPRFATAADRANPLAWSLQGVVPNPVLPDAYPISGFTWLDMYQCYQIDSVTGNNPMVWLLTWLNFLYGSTDATNILHDNGFAEVPGPWVVEVYSLLTDPTNGVYLAGNAGCAGKVGAH